jgi:DNA invertase Pin-like site-specific DNA recombinase
LWDTSSSQGRLLSTLLAAIAEFERDLIRERTGDGRKRAMAKGIKFGRKPKLSDFQRLADPDLPTPLRAIEAPRPAQIWTDLSTRIATAVDRGSRG